MAMPGLDRLALELIRGLDNEDHYCTECIRVTKDIVLCVLVRRRNGGCTMEVTSHTTIFTSLEAPYWDSIRRAKKYARDPHRVSRGWCAAWNHTDDRFKLDISALDWFPWPCSWCALGNVKALSQQLKRHIWFWKAFYAVMSTAHERKTAMDDVLAIQRKMTSYRIREV